MNIIPLLGLLLCQEGPPPLRVEGARVVDPAGKEVLLRGVSMADPSMLGKEWKKDHFELVVRAWKANCVRVPVHPGHWKSKGPEAFDALLDPAVEWCRELGAYLILDYHAIGNPKTGKAQKDKPEYDSSMDLARAFWKRAAARYRDKPWVLYEIFNEPMGITWTDLRPLAAELVGIVRAAAPDSVVIVSATDWTYDLRGPASQPLEAGNLLYAWHVYPVRGTAWDSYIAEARAKFPVIATEWGFDPDGDSVTRGTAEGFARPLLAMMDAHKMHWTAWCYHPQWGPPLLRGWGGELTPFGKLARAWLAGERPPPRPALKEVNDFAYWLQKVDLAALGGSKFDLCVIDPDNDGKPLTRTQVEDLKWSAGGPKVLLAYVSIGEAEDYRAYWQKDWATKPPDWLGPVNPEWPGNYKVRYWDERWQKLVLDAVDRVIAQGFDGAYLDVVDAYEFWQERDKDAKARAKMIDFVVRLSSTAKRRGKGFHVFVQNAEELLETKAYLEAIDGIGREEAYFTKGRNNRPAQVARTQELLDKALESGKKVLVIEYLKEPEWIDWLYERAKAKGYVAGVAPKELDRLLVPKGHEPD
jgi:cysteinyl-tRNA synthetase